MLKSTYLPQGNIAKRNFTSFLVRFSCLAEAEMPKDEESRWKDGTVDESLSMIGARKQN